MSLYHELKRRNVFRVGIAYLALAWLLTEVSGTLFPVFGIPDWGIRLVVIVFALGFLPALIISWVYEITPEGIKREKDVVRDSSITHRTAKRLDVFTIGLIVVALAFLLADRFWLSPRHPEQSAAPAATVTDNGQTSKPEPTEPQYPPNSIAVLPFVNMSDDAGNEYFSDGISEELLNLLAKIPELRVSARTSSFSFKGQNLEIPEIAVRLNVAHVLDGSVRKSGNQVRITAQLVKADSGFQLWSESYDRTLDNIFAIQDEIAAAVVAQLKVTLLGAPPVMYETDPEAYALYLQGRHLNRLVDTAAGYEQALALLQQALVLDPGYAAAWTELGYVYSRQANLGLRTFDEGYTLAREATNKALAIDPDYAPAHARLGENAIDFDNDMAAAARHLQRALQLEPANTDIIGLAAYLTRALDRLDEAIALTEFVVARDPVNPENHGNLGQYYTYAGRWDESIASYSTRQALSPGAGGFFVIGRALLLKGEPQAALEAIQLEEDPSWRMIGLSLVYHALGQADESDAALAELIEHHEGRAAYNIAYILAYRGEADRAFEWLDKAVENKDVVSHSINQPLFSNIHDDPRWLPFLESIGSSPEQLAAIEFNVTLPK